MDDFVDLWSKYDPEATGYIKIEDLSPLLKDLANSTNGSNLFVDKESVSTSEEFRSKLVSSLKIPTFGKFKRVMFYDTLQLMCFRVIHVMYNRTNI